jgi:phosphoglycolate phosphatase-like HAD superfamily hydrolase
MDKPLAIFDIDGVFVDVSGFYLEAVKLTVPTHQPGSFGAVPPSGCSPEKAGNHSTPTRGSQNTSGAY